MYMSYWLNHDMGERGLEAVQVSVDMVFWTSTDGTSGVNVTFGTTEEQIISHNNIG